MADRKLHSVLMVILLVIRIIEVYGARASGFGFLNGGNWALIISAKFCFGCALLTKHLPSSLPPLLGLTPTPPRLLTPLPSPPPPLLCVLISSHDGRVPEVQLASPHA